MSTLKPVNQKAWLLVGGNNDCDADNLLRAGPVAGKLRDEKHKPTAGKKLPGFGKTRCMGSRR